MRTFSASDAGLDRVCRAILQNRANYYKRGKWRFATSGVVKLPPRGMGAR